MTDLNQTVTTDLAARYTKLASYVHDLAAPLTEDQFWTKPFAFGNSVGNLLLHLTGNLSYYIGAQIAGTGYVRDRPREFTDHTRPPKKEVLETFDAAMTIVLQTIRAQTADDWSKPYTAAGVETRDRLDIVLQCATHLHHHIGQMMYLNFALTGKEQ
jgi:hypothetical protein